MRVFFVQGQPGCSEKTQRAIILKETGLAEGSPGTVWYMPRPGKNAEDLTAAAKRARGGAVETAHGLRPLGNSRAAIVAALKKAREETVEAFHILDVVSGRRSDRDGVEMLDDALAKMHGERAMGNRAEAIGALGGHRRASKMRLTRMPRDDAERIWKDPSIVTDKQAAALCGPGWSISTLKRAPPEGDGFGPSGRRPGRRKATSPPAFVTPISETVKAKRAKKRKAAKRRKVVTKRKRK